MSGRRVLALGWGGCLLALAAAAPDLPAPVRFLPFGASLLLFGLPHGAADHLVPAWLSGRPVGWSAAAVGALYAVLGAAYAAVWAVAPVAAFAGFVLLTWYHWGQGDLYAMAAFAGDEHLRSWPQRALTVAVRGGLPMVVPLVAFPATYRRVAAATVAPFGATVPGSVFGPPVTRGVAAGFGALLLAALGVGFVRARARGPRARRHWAVDAAETVLLAGYFLVVPPVLAVGTYFALWHSTRHVARLAPLAAPEAVEGLDAAGFGAFARAAAPLTVVSLLFLGGVTYAVRPATLFEALGVYLLVIAVLTVPHTAIVTWMDREQGLWLS